ncbi:MAG TPA: DinB family protein [Pyrinomonadaceae bacterium]|nr:DinB family protein [Pyrinomonadaceae bacterium]
MGIGESLLPEFDREMASTRKTLERVPDDKFDWKPHAKSASMLELAHHLAHLPWWGGLAIGSDSFDFAPEGTPMKLPETKSTAEVLSWFDENVATTRQAIAGASDDEFSKPWTLFFNKRKIMTKSKAEVLRDFMLSHSIHHRAQLGVYLRLNDIPLPMIYGPTADENPFG